MGLFPDGFYDGEYLKEERDYKVQAHELAKELLGREVFKELIESADFEEATQRALRVVNATNLIFHNEKMSLKGGLLLPEQQKEFSLRCI